MIKIEQQDGTDGHFLVLYFCPGCRTSHGWLPVTIGLDPKTKLVDHWQFNGDAENPTISPSVNVEPNKPEYQCHHFIRNGKIEFQSDCFHSLAGQTVELPEPQKW